MSDDEETVAVDRKRERRDSQRKLEKDEPGAKLKKKARVLVEVKILQHVRGTVQSCSIIFILFGTFSQLYRDNLWSMWLKTRQL